ncbi:hypothetical protein PMAYCL1PPCAC_06721, partial [Pristionchus mayeri]
SLDYAPFVPRTALKSHSDFESIPEFSYEFMVDISIDISVDVAIFSRIMITTRKKRSSTESDHLVDGTKGRKVKRGGTHTNVVNLESVRIECNTSPRTSNDLHMHPRKLTEIRNWMGRDVPRGMLLLTGPPGSGKSTAVRVLGSKLNIVITEWIESDHEIEEDSFQEILLTRPLNRNGITLVRHLPHSLYNDIARFNELLRSIPSCSSIIFCLPCTVSTWYLNPIRLFNLKICEELRISQITTNPFALTFLTKAMKSVIGKNSDCRDAELTEIAKIADGDIRKALIILDLRVRFGKGNAYDKADSPISLFHSVGRIVYAKRAETSHSSWTRAEHILNNEHLRRPQPDFDVNALIEDSPHDSQKLISFVFEHCPRFTPFSSLHKVFDSISLADSSLHVWDRRNVFDQYALQTVVRSSLFYNYRENGPEQRSKYTFTNPLMDQLMKEMRKLSSENEVSMCWRKEYYTEIVPMMSQMGSLPPSMNYFSHPLGSEVWKKGLDNWKAQGSYRMAKTSAIEEEEHVEFDIVETDDSDTDSF